MTPEQKKEVIKAAAYGHNAQFIAKCNDLDVKEVEIVIAEMGSTIATKRESLKEAYPNAF